MSGDRVARMSEIPPTPPAGLLVSDLPLPVAPPIANMRLPPTLPVQILALPPNWTPPAQPLTVDGLLQLLLNGKATLTSQVGDIALNLPQIRGNPALFQTIRNALGENATVQLRLTPGAGGVLDAQLLFPTSLQNRPAVTVTSPSIAQFIGTTLQAVVLPATVQQQTAAAIKDAAQQQLSLQTAQTALQNPAAAQLGAPTANGKLETLIRNLLTPAQGNDPQPTPTAASTPPQLPPGGQPLVAVRLQQVIPPGQPLPQPEADSFLAQVPAQVNPGAPALVTAGNGSLLIKTTATLPAGATLLLKLLPQADVSAESGGAAGGEWPALQELVSGLNHHSPPALQQFLQLRLPQPNAALPGALLFLLSAMQSGEARQWLGRSASATLESDKAMLLEALQGEFKRGSTTTSDPVIGEWRSYQVPLHDQGQLQPLFIYVHHNAPRPPRDGETAAAAADPAKKQTRFIIDVTFTRLGKMQLDGFVQAQQFDLIVRSEQTLGSALRDELRGAFGNALEATGYHGQLLFQTDRQGWLHLAPARHGQKSV